MMLKYTAEFDLALTYSLRRPKLAKECANAALLAAQEMRRPDLAFKAQEVLAAL